MIQLEKISRHFQVGDQVVKALDEVDLNISAGEYISIMGPSGSGKSTLLNVLGLLDRPTSGQYLFENRNVTQFSDEQLADFRRDHIGFVFQFFHLIPRLTAAENIELPMTLAGIPAEQRHQRTRDILQSFDMLDRAHHQPNQLSGGQRQRVAIARATILRPSIILADEPTGNLDRHSGKEVIEVLESLLEQNITLITVTHDPDIGARARRKLKMVDGRIIGDETS
ncbi:MAG: ABC transporter ATP-binding protein [Thioalkalispiraceae bacterium]|jgi:putative ABC transport system ATP-binding protein